MGTLRASSAGIFVEECMRLTKHPNFGGKKFLTDVTHLFIADFKQFWLQKTTPEHLVHGTGDIVKDKQL